MQKIFNPNKKDWPVILKRPTQTFDDIEGIVSEVFKDIQIKGDEAVFKYIKKFDGADVEDLFANKSEIERSRSEVSAELKESIQLAKLNIEKFHKAQVTMPVKVETVEGVTCWQEKRPIQKVGLYIPGGSAPLFSTILMLAVPAQIAGCKEIVLCTPSDKNGNVNPAILYTANLCGISKIIKVGGIQAIAGMTFGTESIPKVYKIFGPGNQFVTVAKQMATKYNVAIDIPAGPSELLILADDSANASFVASDLLSQAEHGKDSQVIMVSTSKEFIDKVETEINEQIELLPRKEIAKDSISNSKLIYCDSLEISMDLINEYAPEHFIVCTRENEFVLSKIQNAGSVFIGNYTSESAGDYASGTNHTLPTNGNSKAYSGVNLDSFLKAITFQKITKSGIKNIGVAIENMAEAEGLQAHKNAITLRLKSLGL